MKRKILMVSMFLFTLALPAAKAALPCTGPCPHYRESFGCNSNAECFWDTDDQRCESRICSTGSCGTYRSAYYCNSDSRCFWDTDDQRCESRESILDSFASKGGPAACTTQCTGRSVKECGTIADCYWDKVDKRCESHTCSPGECGTIADTTKCDATAGCFWDQDDKRCESRTSGFAAYWAAAKGGPVQGPAPACTTQCTGRDVKACGEIADCFWDKIDKRCESRTCSPGECGTLTDTQKCDATPGCFWDTTDKRCESRT